MFGVYKWNEMFYTEYAKQKTITMCGGLAIYR
jgi:hypothetical protein